jgi:hypothetical protein
VSCPTLRKEEVGRSSVAEERREPSHCSLAPTDGSYAPMWRRPTMEDGAAAWLLGGDREVDDRLWWRSTETSEEDDNGVAQRHRPWRRGGGVRPALVGTATPINARGIGHQGQHVALGVQRPVMEEEVSDRWGRSQIISN